jgi:hypothetical protein
VHRRHVDDVEAELGELRQHALDTLEPSPGAREQLVPRAEARELDVDVDLVGWRGGRLGAVGTSVRERLLDGHRLDAVERGALRELAREVLLLRLDLALDLVAPRRVPVDPGLDRELPAAAAVRDEARRPAVVALEAHTYFLPAPLALAPVLDGDAEHLVPVAEDVGRDVDLLADRPLDRVASSVDLRRHALDLDTARRFFPFGRGHATLLISLP